MQRADERLTWCHGLRLATLFSVRPAERGPGGLAVAVRLGRLPTWRGEPGDASRPPASLLLRGGAGRSCAAGRRGGGEAGRCRAESIADTAVDGGVWRRIDFVGGGDELLSLGGLSRLLRPLKELRKLFIAAACTGSQDKRLLSRLSTTDTSVCTHTPGSPVEAF